MFGCSAKIEVEQINKITVGQKTIPMFGYLVKIEVEQIKKIRK